MEASEGKLQGLNRQELDGFKLRAHEASTALSSPFGRRPTIEEDNDAAMLRGVYRGIERVLGTDNDIRLRSEMEKARGEVERARKVFLDAEAELHGMLIGTGQAEPVVHLPSGNDVPLTKETK